MPENVIFGTGPLGLAVARRLSVAGAEVRLVIEMVFSQVGGTARLQGLPSFAIAVLGLFVPPVAAVKETLYQSEHAWVVDDSKFTRAFGSRPTPHDQAIKQTLDWFRSAGV